MKRFVFFCLVCLLAACGTSPTSEPETSVNSSALEAVVEDESITEASSFQLSADYEDALSVEQQLAIGIIQLETTNFAVDQAQASELLPLWQQLQRAVRSGNNLDALLGQIHDNMTPAQLGAIAGMGLTNESLETMLLNGELTLSRLSASLAQQMSERVLNEQNDSAETDSEDSNINISPIIVTGAVVRLLQQRSMRGDQPEIVVGPTTIGIQVVQAATGLSDVEMAIQMRQKRLVEILEENGADVEAVRGTLISELTAIEETLNDSAEAWAEKLLARE